MCSSDLLDQNLADGLPIEESRMRCPPGVGFSFSGYSGGSFVPVAVSPDGSRLYAGTTDGQIVVFDLRRREFMESVSVGAFCHSMAITPDGSKLLMVIREYSNQADGKLVMMDIGLKDPREYNPPLAENNVIDEVTLLGMINSVAIEHNGQYAYVTTEIGRAHV